MGRTSMDSLMKRADSKYSLVVATARRARMLTDGDEPLVEGVSVDSIKSVTIAMKEIAAGKINIIACEGGIK